MKKLTPKALEAYKSFGWIDNEAIVALATGLNDNAPYVICVCEESVTVALAYGEEPDSTARLFKSPIVMLEDMELKKSLFKTTLTFNRAGNSYAFRINGGARLVEYFKLYLS